jgi:hypothetical protein
MRCSVPASRASRASSSTNRRRRFSVPAPRYRCGPVAPVRPATGGPGAGWIRQFSKWSAQNVHSRLQNTHGIRLQHCQVPEDYGRGPLESLDFAIAAETNFVRSRTTCGIVNVPDSAMRADSASTPLPPSGAEEHEQKRHKCRGVRKNQCSHPPAQPRKPKGCCADDFEK